MVDALMATLPFFAPASSCSRSAALPAHNFTPFAAVLSTILSSMDSLL